MDADNITIHSAAELCDLEAAELLLKEKLDIYAKDEKDMTPLHILMQKKIEIYDYVRRGGDQYEKEIKIIEKFIEMLLKHSSNNPDCTKDTSLLNFHAACTLENCAITEGLLEKITNINQPISENSSIWPGYTALHFAVRCCSIETTKMLVEKGGNMLTCDKEDGKTKLMDYMSVLHDEDSHKKFVQSMGKKVGASLSKDSPLWPGQTILHIAVTLLQERKLDMIRDILTQGADVTTQDSNGSTPVHLALCRNKLEFINNLFQYHKKVLNPLNKDNLSHLHIASIVNNKSIVKKLVTIEANINIAYNGKPLPNVKSGWTPLHIACVADHSNVAKTLLAAGANLLQTDAEGFTAIHCLFGTIRKKHLALEVLIASGQFKECVVESIGLTHLHVMASYNKTEVIKRLLDQGANTEATIENVEGKNLKQFVGCKPLHLATMNKNLDAIKLLLERGADILAIKPDKTCPLSEALSGKYDEYFIVQFVSLLWDNKKLQKQIEMKIGLTTLHLVCYTLDLEKIKNILKKKINVNARVRDDSPIWPGFTPLHVLTYFAAAFASGKDVRKNVKNATILLLDMKADVTLINAEGNTPVHLTLEDHTANERFIRASLLMKHHRDFRINPTNKQGLSHFHIACLVCDLTAVKGFLQHGADVNQPVNESDGEFAQRSPLHLALNPVAKKIPGTKLQLQVVDALLETGANVDAVGARGWTLIHNVAECRPARQQLLERIVRTNTDMNKETIKGETPFEILLKYSPSVDEVKLFIELGSRVNSYNRVSNKGYMTMVITRASSDNRMNLLNLMMSQPDIAEVDERGRNAIYNTFCGRRMHLSRDEYAALIEKLIKLGCNIHQQDRDGKTPLHVAIELCDESAVHALLRCGADINLVDDAGHSPFSYWFKRVSTSNLSTVLIAHLRILQLVGLEVSPLNDHLLTEARYKIEIDEITLRGQLENTKEVKIGERGLTLYDFVFESNVGKLISLFTPAERNIVGSILESIDYEKFGSLSNLFKLQYRKVLERLPLMTPASKSFIILLGFPLPDLCIEVVFKFLSNVELKNLVSAAIDNDDLEMVTG